MFLRQLHGYWDSPEISSDSLDAKYRRLTAHKRALFSYNHYTKCAKIVNP